MDLTDTSNQRLLLRSIPVRSAPNGLLFGWDLALYRGRQHYSTLDVAPDDWEDHWLQAFCPLLFTWSGKKEAKNLIRVDWLGSLEPVDGEGLFSGFYVNELILRFTEREDPHEGLFDAYVKVLAALSGPAARRQPALRNFETALLSMLGWAIVRDRADAPRYRFSEGRLEGVDAPAGEGLFSRTSVEALLSGTFGPEVDMREVRRLIRTVIDYHMDGRDVNTRRVLSELRQY